MTVETLNPEVQEGVEPEKASLSLAERARQALKEVQEETEKRMKDLMDRGELYGKESLQSIKDRIAPAVRLSENLLNRAKSNAEWVQEKVEETVTGALSKLHLPTPSEFHKIQETTEVLVKKIEALGKVTESIDATEKNTEALKELRNDVTELQKSFNNLSKNVQLLDRKVRKLGQSALKRSTKGTKPAPKTETGK